MRPLLSRQPLPVLYRKRFIPDEMIRLADDQIRFINSEILVTDWTTIKPRKDFTQGRSCYFLEKGFKISRFMNEKHQTLFTYCDIIETVYDSEEHAYIFYDLLLDVIIANDGFVKVLDLKELADALDQRLISTEIAQKALRLLDELLALIYDGRFSELSHCLDIC